MTADESTAPRPSPGEASLLLRRAAAGEAPDAARLQALLHDELHDLARRAMAGERADHTLQATALVNEAWLKLFDRDALAVEDRRHFLAVSARAMRQVLVDHARGRNRLKRGGAHERVELDTRAHAAGQAPPPDLEAVDVALDELRERSERQAQVVELRFFGGASHAEIAEVLGTSERTVDREWRFARAWLAARIEGFGREG